MNNDASGRISRFPHLRQDFAASLVVFLVALPLCVGVAVASGVPAELGLVTGIVGGLVTGSLRGSSLQVSGPGGRSDRAGLRGRPGVRAARPRT